MSFEPTAATAGPDEGRAPGEERFVLSPRLSVESVSAGRVVVFHPELGTRLALTRPLYELVRSFREPVALRDVLAADGRGDRAERCLLDLVDRGYLVPTDVNGVPVLPEPVRCFTSAEHTLFRTPRAGAETPAAHVGVAGVPYDLGAASWPGARRGPDTIRERSYDTDYRRDASTGRPLGWFDVQRKTRVLEGVTIEDHGDVWFRYGEPPGQVQARIGDACRRVVEAGSFPVFLGGDHSVAFPLARYHQSRGPVAVLCLDAHTDADRYTPGDAANAQNVGRALLSLPNVERLVQVGHRGYTFANKLDTGTPRHRVVTAWDVRDEGPEAVLALLPEELPVYLTNDLCVLDPGVAPAVNAPSPDGFALAEAKRLLRVVGAARQVAGMDVCELNPERAAGPATAKSACHLLFAALGAVEHQLRSED